MNRIIVVIAIIAVPIFIIAVKLYTDNNEKQKAAHAQAVESRYQKSQPYNVLEYATPLKTSPKP